MIQPPAQAPSIATVGPEAAQSSGGVAWEEPVEWTDPWGAYSSWVQEVQGKGRGSGKGGRGYSTRRAWGAPPFEGGRGKGKGGTVGKGFGDSRGKGATKPEPPSAAPATPIVQTISGKGAVNPTPSTTSPPVPS